MLVPSEAFSVFVEPSNGAAHLRLSGRFDVAAVRALDDLIDVTQRLSDTDRSTNGRHGRRTAVMSDRR